MWNLLAGALADDPDLRDAVLARYAAAEPASDDPFFGLLGLALIAGSDDLVARISAAADRLAAQIADGTGMATRSSSRAA
ncbi:hypothetical protein [Methylobacterium sp. A54F]